MQMTPQITKMDDGRLHLNHGPIDLIIAMDGEAYEITLAKQQAILAFETVLLDLSKILPDLRKPFSELQALNYIFENEIARNMLRVVSQFPTDFITPMAAVAGCVADYILACSCEGRSLKRVSVNNGGDIAFYLNVTEKYKTAICNLSGEALATIEIHHEDEIAGIATSGCLGRSYSLGIADSVTVLAKNAGLADAAATLIANAVDLPQSEKVKRMAANELSPDIDLGDRQVTVEVHPLCDNEIKMALAKGQKYAAVLEREGLIDGAFIMLQNQFLTIGSANKNRSIIHHNIERERQYA
jgi:ApbE superfamily uncharacterized protein (UPF0280 family)